MSVIADLVGVVTPSTGTGGPLSLGAAILGHRTFLAANAAGHLPNGSVVSYTILNGDNAESCSGTYNSVANTLTRNTLASTTGSPLNLTGTSNILLAANASDFPFVPSPVAGGWLAGRASWAVRNGFFSTGSASFHPITIPNRRTLDRLACLVWEAASAGAAAKLALYNSGSNGFPLTKLTETATTLDTTTAGQKIGTLVSNPTVNAGVCWAGFTSNSNTGVYLNEETMSQAIAELGIATSIPATNDFSDMRVTHPVTWAGSGEIFPSTLTSLSISYNSFEFTPSVFARCV